MAESAGIVPAVEGLSKRDSDYNAWIQELGKRYQCSQIKASVAVNKEMLLFYWSLGRDIVGMQAENRYGSGFYTTLSRDLKEALPNANCFSITNLKYMKRFFELFPEDAIRNRPQVGDDFGDNPIAHQFGAQLELKPASNHIVLGNELFSVPWGHIKLLLDRCKGNRAKAEFYIHETVQNGWSRAMLLNHLDAALYERQGKAMSNFKTALPEPQSDLAQQVTRDPYQFDFLTIRKDFDERELKDALVDNISSFLLEMGAGFSFIGREYRLVVGETELWVDLLFYHFKLRCFVVVEVKVVPFEPGFIGQLGTYVSAVNHLLKGGDDQPTIGLLICKTKDDVLAQYALEGSGQPIGISEYGFSQAMPEELKSSLPTIEEIEAELR